MKKLTFKNGFTLIELLVVISIIGVLATVVLSSLGDARDKAKQAKALAEMKQIATAFQVYLLDTNSMGINLPAANNGGAYSWHDPDCNGSFNIDTTGNDWPNGQLLNFFDDEIDEYFDTSRTNPWGYQYEIDAAYNCNVGQSGCEPNTWVYAIVANTTEQAVNTYVKSDVVYTICTHG